ncbi:hypothetical protein P280DRAFT_392899 [Massarina eburnea CBS 473.64]|uniref:Conidiation-specific expression protein n=1 Tax=Massarina eburnea CBS 473.64 TaxID=1395130 RepID=A0A6A6S9D9_9PLEO|nr:hypothetical protein P280DRAFT_392899 [Massarina eburnea CBS 473.64]
MPSPFHQKYSSQNHKYFGENTTPSMPEGPKQDAERRESNASIGSTPSTAERRRPKSSASRFANLEALKRPTDDASINRRASLQDSYGKSGFLESMWNNFTRGPASPSSPRQTKEARDTTTLRQ